MSNPFKLGPVRQLSLRCETPTLNQRRKTLKKQFSEDVVDSKRKDANLRISSAQVRHKNNKDRPLVRQAWSENVDDKPKAEEGLVAKKCKEVARKPQKITKQSSLDNDSILYSRQELADRLRIAWKEREKEKHNLNIFLTHTTKEKNFDDQTDIEITETTEKTTPKIILPLTPDPLQDNNHIKNIFQKQIRKNIRLTHCDVSPRALKTEQKPNTVVVVPLIIEQKTEKLQGKEPTDLVRPIENVTIRPATASAKRQSFQKRTNSAFNGSITHFKAPLVKTSSVPSKPQNNTKFIASKRKLKTSRRKSSSKNCSTNVSDDEFEGSVLGDDLGGTLTRSVSVNGVDVVTMVSLVSPSESEAEEEVEEKVNSRNNSPVKEDTKRDDGGDKQRNFALRKSVKTVSFQQSSIHAVRSFSASFPARRNSTGLLYNGAKFGSKVLEKRGTTDSSSETESVPKRRLVRAQSCDGPERSSLENMERNNSLSENDDRLKSGANAEENVENESEENGNSLPKSAGPKEKQCWEMYRKMTEKGVNVSFDTILRGMLTPTEYRVHRNQSQSSIDNW